MEKLSGNIASSGTATSEHSSQNIASLDDSPEGEFPRRFHSARCLARLLPTPNGRKCYHIYFASGDETDRAEAEKLVECEDVIIDFQEPQKASNLAAN